MTPCEQALTPYEQRLRDEVIYLHSLWHQGPPNPPQNPPYISHHLAHLTTNPQKPTHHLSVSNPTAFKRTRRNTKHKPRTPSGPGSDPPPDPGPEWPVNNQSSAASPSNAGTSGWPALKAISSTSSARQLSCLELADIANMKMQQKVVKACNEFFAKRVGFDGSEDDEFYEEDDDCDVEGSDEFEFILSLFVENQELRSFYEGNQESGDFYCLVCGGVGEKMGKKFKGCVSLVQHAIAISKTKTRRAHKAFGQVICRVVGWDFGRLPVIVLKGETLSQSLKNSGQTQLK